MDKQRFENFDSNWFFANVTLDEIKQCLADGANVNIRRQGFTPLHGAILFRCDPEIVTTLIEAGAQINAQTDNGETPLYCAAFENQPESAGLLLEAGAQIELANKKGHTPLYICACRSEPELATLLLAAGANIDHRDSIEGNTLLHGAGYRCWYPEVIQTLVDAGADIHARNQHGMVPLHKATMSDNEEVEVVNAMLEAGANPNHCNNDGQTPLHFVRQHSSAAIAATLLASGADPNHLDKGGNTPLHAAAEHGKLAQVIVDLIAAGADIARGNNNGETAWDLARGNKHLQNSAVLAKLVAARRH